MKVLEWPTLPADRPVSGLPDHEFEVYEVHPDGEDYYATTHSRERQTAFNDAMHYAGDITKDGTPAAIYEVTRKRVMRIEP